MPKFQKLIAKYGGSIVTCICTKYATVLYTYQDVLNGSDHQAVLQMVNLVAGWYIFSLKVTDRDGLSNTDSATVVVKEGNNMMHLY